jgi:hypothetical protein
MQHQAVRLVDLDDAVQGIVEDGALVAGGHSQIAGGVVAGLEGNEDNGAADLLPGLGGEAVGGVVEEVAAAAVAVGGRGQVADAIVSPGKKTGSRRCTQGSAIAVSPCCAAPCDLAARAARQERGVKCISGGGTGGWQESEIQLSGAVSQFVLVPKLISLGTC